MKFVFETKKLNKIRLFLMAGNSQKTKKKAGFREIPLCDIKLFEWCILYVCIF